MELEGRRLPRIMKKGLLSLLNYVDEFSRVVAILVVTDLFTWAVVAQQDVELAGFVSFRNR